MDQTEKDRIAAELAAEYRQTIRDTAATEARTRKTSNKTRGFKSMGAAYLFWFFLGGIGAHRFYLGYVLSGGGMLLISVFIFIFSILPFFFVFAYPLLALLTVWWLADAFLIPRMMPELPNY
jgi:TM2 domain-containing membrane protein YozV